MRFSNAEGLIRHRQAFRNFGAGLSRARGRVASPADKFYWYLHGGAFGRTNVRYMINLNKWNTHITALRKYVERTGTSRVPRNHVEATELGNVKLGVWVSYVRHRQRKGHLSAEQVSELSTFPNWQWEKLPAGRTGDAERDARIIERFHQGTNLSTLAGEFGLTRQRIHQIVSSHK